MNKVKVLGIVGSPRKNGNTWRLVEHALKAASSVRGVETQTYQLAGKNIHHCIGCFKCAETGQCVFNDDLADFVQAYLEADGIIWGAPVYHMSVPASMKAAIDRMGNLMAVSCLRQGADLPRLSKACGVVTTGGSRFGGQELVLSFMIHSSLLMNGVVVAGDPAKESYVGAAAFSGDPDFFGVENVLNDKVGLAMAASVGSRVAEMTKIIRSGVATLGEELPSEYFVKPDISS